MKQIILLSTFYFLLSTINSFSQIKFNYTYENMTWAMGRNVFALSDTGYAIVGGAQMINEKLNISILATDSFGNELWIKHYGNDTINTYHGAENACIKTNGGYVLAASINGGGYVGTHFVDTASILIVKFNEVFDTLWTRKYFTDTNFIATRGICATDDGGYLIVGETELNNDSVWTSNQTKGLMLKVDSEGNYEWFKSYGTDEHMDNFYKCVQTHDGGYLVGGSTKSWQEELAYIDQGDWYIVKTDSQGNEEWTRRYGNPIYDDYRISQILRATDTTYYITGAWTYDRNNTGSTVYQESYIVKLDQNFDEVYQLKYDNQEYFSSYIMAAIETADSNIILASSRQDFGEGFGYYPRAVLTKMTPEGEILWERQFVAANDTTESNNKGYSVKQTSDGGYILGGWTNLSSLNPSQQLWLVKTDSVGCDGTCDFVNINSPCFATSLDEHTACESYEWVNGVEYTQSNHTAYNILENAAVDGRDSVVFLNLTINYNVESTDSHQACYQYTWIDGQTYTQSNHIATQSYTSATGCDSVVTLDLSINTVDVSVTETDPSISANLETGTYQWIDCSNNLPIEGANNSTFLAEQNGVYAVIINNGICTDTSDCVTISTVGTALLNVENNEIVIYPNPAKDVINISYNIPAGAGISGKQQGIPNQVWNVNQSIKIYNTQGQLVFNSPFRKGARGINGQQINISDLQKGVYFIKIGAKTTKFIVK